MGASNHFLRRCSVLAALRPVAVSLAIALSTVSCTGVWGTTGPSPVAVKEFTLAPGQAVVGDVREYVVQEGDVFPEIARRFSVGYTALAAANPGVDPWAPGVGRKITIPSLYVLPNAPRQGIIINLAQWRLFYFPPDGNRVETFPVGLGQIGKTTPLGTTRVVHKKAGPTWHPPASVRAEKPELPASVPPGRDNPLGAFALYLGWNSYLIHGTNKPDGVGRNVSHGCIRLYPEDIERLFAEVSPGTPVRTVSQPATAGWVGDRLYLEVYPSKTQTEEIGVERPVSFDPARNVRAVVRAAAGRYADSVEWHAVDAAAEARTGGPVIVADRSMQARRTEQPKKAQDEERPMSRPDPSARRRPNDRYISRLEPG